MNQKILLIFAAASLTQLGACEKAPEPPKTAETTVTPETVDTRAPEATMTCPSASAKRIAAASGEKIEATDDAVTTALQSESGSASAANQRWAGKSFEEFLPTVTKECGDDGKYIVNGDVAISDIKQLREFFELTVQGTPPPPIQAMVAGKMQTSSALVINTVGGSPTAWSAAQKRQITYCIHNFFNSKKPQVIADMAAAAGAWEAVSDVKFVYVPQQDASCNAANNNVVFDVRPVDVGGDYLARAFFPNEPRARRNVLIDLSALSLTPGQALTLSGVLRHELGHSLGFRHEHTRPESGACFEDSNWKPITSYDRFSVMHYPQCNGGADWKLLLTDRDKNGSACVYGAAPGFAVDPGMVLNVGQCTTNPPIPSQAPVAVSHAAQTVTLNQQQSYPVLAAKPGSIVRMKMTGSGASSGDPDLYVSLGTLAPRVSPPRYNCRPYLTGPNENCELTVQPAPNNLIRYMVHGYAAGAYDLQITYVPFTNP
jgi:serine protease